MLDTVKNCDVSSRAIQVLFRSVTRSVNTVEDDYNEHEIQIKPHLQPLDLQGELIGVDFHLMGC